MTDRIENLIIIGSGPAGYTAALYASRADLEPLVIEGFVWGGLLQTTTDVENYPGFPEGIMGPEMMQKFRDRKIMVVSGGDSAMEEAIFLSKFGRTVKVVHRRDEFRASSIMAERAREIENIEFLTPYVVDRFEARDGGSLTHAVLRHSDSGEELDVDVDGVFVAIGHEPSWQIVRGQVDTDENGYALTEGKSTRTSVAGVFAAGDLVDHTYRQAITAAGSGCQAALDAEWYLRDNPLVPTPAALEGTGDLAEAQWAPEAARS